MNKILNLSLVGAIVGLLPVASWAVPYYVGENPTPQTRVILGLKDAMTRQTTNVDKANFADISITGQYQIMDNFATGADLPIFMNSEPVGEEDFQAGIGNISLMANWNDGLLEDSSRFRFGYFVQAKAYLPTNRSEDSLPYTSAYAPTELYTYFPYTSTIAPGAGIFVSQNRWSAKTNLTYGLHHISNTDFAAGDDIRNSGTYQLGASFHPTANTNLSLEYNMILMDDELAGDLDNWRHHIAPSLSGEYKRFVGALYSVVPLDGDSRELSSLLFGAEVGYSF